jgi:glycosyltransferase involved in cell wall biosynthesis
METGSSFAAGTIRRFEQTPIRVLQLKHVPGNPSMTRFAEELGAELPNGGELAVEQFAPRLRGGSARRNYLARLVSYPVAVRRLEADVFHLLDHGLGYLAAALPGPRTVVTCHDLAPLRAERSDRRFRTGWATLARYRLVARILPRVAAVVCDSEATRRDLLSLTDVDPARTETVRPGLSPAFRPLGEAERRDASDRIGFGKRRLVLHVSATRYPYKNVPGVLRVVAALRAGGIDAALLRVGRPLYRHERRLAERLGLDGVIREVGPVSDEELTGLYNAADAFLFPSYHEGFGWPPLEAMACGTPVVASDCAALTESLGDAALSAPADDADGLAEAMATVFASPELAASLRERGLRRASRFSWSSAAERYAGVYRGVARGAAASRARRSIVRNQRRRISRENGSTTSQ